MPSLERFERLINTTVPLKPLEFRHIGSRGEQIQSWLSMLNRLPRNEQINQTKTTLTELIVSDISDESRLTILDTVNLFLERLVLQLQNDYLRNPQNSRSEQDSCINEVRSLYYLQILCHQGIAIRNYQELTPEPVQPTQNTSGGWLKGLTNKFKSPTPAPVAPPPTIAPTTPQKRLMTLAIYRIMSTYFKLIHEFALTYQKVPAVFWGQMNAWYFKSATQGIDKLDINKLDHTIPNNSIHQQYTQSCLASFANLFAYRQTDIISIFKLIPTWIPYIQTTFTAHSHFKVFVNLQASTPPEFITPYATVNPYSNEQVCLFIDVKDLFNYLKELESAEGPFESRIAKIIMLAFGRYLDSNTGNTRINEHLADMMTGFFPIFDKLSNGKNFASLIHQSALPEAHHPRITNRTMLGAKEVAKVMTKNDTNVQFMFGNIDGTKPVDIRHLNISVFGLFALKAHQTTDKHPWKLGVIQWAELTDTQIAIDGKFFGKILSVCGIRLRASAGDARPQDFIQGILVAGDGVNQHTSLVMPRYHFKEGDTVVLRVDTKESTMRLEKSLLVADDFEQYEIVRLV